ncbi:MAG TPA: nucleotidyltransferase domain-containing protein [Candidatus Limnocylindrales bacterium]
MTKNPVTDARALVAELFPHALWAVLTGSVITPARTAGSDLDIVVMLPDGDPRAPHRDSRRFRGWPVELFVHDEASLAHYLAKELGARKPSLHRMVGAGYALVGDAGPWQETCAKVLAGGPPPLSQAERDRARYVLTDLLDDLSHATDPGERVVIAECAWQAAGDHTLSFAGRWSGSGKWLLRELRDFDPATADRWLAAHGNPDAIAAFVRDLLDRNGGPLFEGYTVPGERP